MNCVNEIFALVLDDACHIVPVSLMHDVQFVASVVMLLDSTLMVLYSNMISLCLCMDGTSTFAHFEYSAIKVDFYVKSTMCVTFLSY